MENTAEAYNKRGLTYYEQQDYLSALEEFNKAIELNPNLTQAYTIRGLAYLKTRRYR